MGIYVSENLQHIFPSWGSFGYLAWISSSQRIRNLIEEKFLFSRDHVSYIIKNFKVLEK